MHPKTLDRLNGVLADHLGRNRFGEPLYFWARSPDIRIPVLSRKKLVFANGIFSFRQMYEWSPQIEQDCWLLAGWIEPVPYAQWFASFGDDVAWPERGMHYATDVILKPGVEPNDAATNDQIGKIRRFRHLTETQILDASLEKTARIEQAEENRIEAYVRSRAITHLPGKCVGRVFGGTADEARKPIKVEELCEKQ
jgi:hypothetical protein